MVIREQDLKDVFEAKVQERFERDNIPLPSGSAMSRLRWAVAAAYVKCLGADKANAEKSKAVKKKEPTKKEPKKKKEPEPPNAGVSLDTMGMFEEMTSEDKAKEADDRKKAADERAEIEAAQRLEAGGDEGIEVYPEGHRCALVKKCKGCKKADTDRNTCKIYTEPERAWRHKSGKCPGSAIIK